MTEGIRGSNNAYLPLINSPAMAAEITFREKTNNPAFKLR